MKLFPSLMAGDVLQIAQNITQLEPWCDGFHIDSMDFSFVDNAIGGPPLVNAIAHYTKKKLWIHLMVKDPENYIQKMTLRNHDIVSVHYESTSASTLATIFRQLRDQKIDASLAISPATPIGVVS